jgi:hypothetical protein
MRRVDDGCRLGCFRDLPPQESTGKGWVIQGAMGGV